MDTRWHARLFHDAGRLGRLHLARDKAQSSAWMRNHVLLTLLLAVWDRQYLLSCRRGATRPLGAA